MNKYIISSLLVLIYCYFSASSAGQLSTPEKNKFNIDLNWRNKSEKKDKHSHPFKNIHTVKTIFLNPKDQHYKFGLTESSILEGKLPVSLTLFVKPLSIDAEKIDLQFEFLDSGFAQKETVLTQPKMISNNGQNAKLNFSELANPYLSLKISGNWF